MKIGIMGGTFDPIHNGHLMLAENADQIFRLDEVWFLPNGHPPHKQSETIQTVVKQRLDMVALAIEGYPHFHLERYEAFNPQISYSFETMEYLCAQYASHEFYFIIGADSLLGIETWAKPEHLFPTCTILAAYRDDMDTKEEMYAQIDYLKIKYDARIELLATPLMDISSSEIRKRVHAGADISNMVPELVARYILENKLYGENGYETGNR